MKTIAVKAVPIHQIMAGEGFAARCESKVVSDLVHAIRTQENPEIPPVAIRQRDKRVASGEDTLAAHVVLGRATVKAHILELDDEEFVALRTVDEARIEMGREAYREATVALIDKVENRAESERVRKRDHALETRGVDIGLTRGVKTTRGEARKLIAELIGTTVDALRKAEARRLPKPAPMVKKEWKLECYGNVASAALLADAKRIHTAMGFVDTYLRNAQRETSKVDDTRLGHDRYTRLHEALHSCAVLARQNVPSHLCPWCKDVAVVRGVCAACWGGGYVAEAHFDSAPDQLKAHPCVSYGGQYVDPHSLKPYRFPEAPVAREPEEFVEGFYADSEPPVAYETQAEPELDDEVAWIPSDPSPDDIQRIRESCEDDVDVSDLEPEPFAQDWEEGDELL